MKYNQKYCKEDFTTLHLLHTSKECKLHVFMYCGHEKGHDNIFYVPNNKVAKEVISHAKDSYGVFYY